MHSRKGLQFFFFYFTYDTSVFPVTVFMEIVEEKSRYALQEHLHLITAPLQVIWGKQDQVILVSVFGFFSLKWVWLSAVCPGGGCLWSHGH